MYADDGGLIERIKWWAQGRCDRVVALLVNLAKDFDVVKEVLGHVVDTPGHGVGLWDGVGGVVDEPCDQNASLNEPDFAENVSLASPDRPPPYEVRRVNEHGSSYDCLLQMTPP